MIDEEIVKNGYFTVWLDTDEAIVKEIQEYNVRMGQLRIKRKAVDEIEFGVILVNLLVIVGIISARFSLNPIFEILTVTDILFFFLRKHYVDFLKKQTGYPLFKGIELTYKDITESDAYKYDFSAER